MEGLLLTSSYILTENCPKNDTIYSPITNKTTQQTAGICRTRGKNRSRQMEKRYISMEILHLQKIEEQRPSNRWVDNLQQTNLMWM